MTKSTRPKLHILIGNIGVGKTTLARKLMVRDGAVTVNMDAIQATLHSNEYGRYNGELKAIYRKMEEDAIKGCLREGYDVVIDRTSMTAAGRRHYIEMAQGGAEVIAWDFGRGTKEALNRRLADNRGVPNGVWKKNVYDKMFDLYEPPHPDEGFSIIRDVSHKEYFILAIDFDGTIVDHQYPYVGEPDPRVVDAIRQAFMDLDNFIIVHTCREDNKTDEARHFMNKNGIPFDTINENPLVPEHKKKIFAHVYVDDRAMSIDSFIGQFGETA